jgi:GT2 family glycosyltransferase
LEYLKLCLQSIYAKITYPCKIIISDAGSKKDVWDYLNTLKGITVVGEPGKHLTYLEVCKQGLKKSFSRFFVLLDSDVIVSEGWLENLVEQMEVIPRLAACEALTDWNSKYIQKDGRLKSIQLALYSDMIQQRSPDLTSICAFMKEINKQCKGMFSEQRWVSMHATMFARTAVEEIGLDTGDFCNALKRAGYKIGQTNGSVLFPLGHRTYDIKKRDRWTLEEVFKAQ